MSEFDHFAPRPAGPEGVPPNTAPAEMPRGPLALRLLYLGLWLFGLWFFFAVLTPRMAALCPAWRRFYAVQEEHGLHSGALYYTDVPVTQEAEAHVREAVRKGMRERRERRERQRMRGAERWMESRHPAGTAPKEH